MTRLTLFLIASLVIVDSILTSSSSSREDSNEKHDSDHSHRDKKHGSKHHHNKKHKKQDEKSNLVENQDEIPDEGWDFENTTSVDNRRILFSKNTEKGKRPYMVYLQLTKESAKAHKYRGWLCGGVIVDQYYVLTSAACVEDADRFYIVSGTTKFVDSFDYKSDECICKHRRKVVWKCIPKNYKFDFQDSIKWSSNDIAIIKVDKAFKFGVVEGGCEFAVCPINYNNISRELEKPGTKGWISGWGSGNNFREGVYRRQEEVHIPKNAKCLQEAKVCIMDNEVCARKWAQRFREIITQFMICTRDVMKRLSEVCDKRYANCTDFDARRREETEVSNNIGNVDIGRHLREPNDYTARRSSMQGGFCENDHGGPLIIRHKGKETVVGVISACKIDPKSHSCHGPFLYTSIYRNRQFISCAIHKDIEENCRRVFRTGITHEEWSVNWDDVKDEDDNDTGKKADTQDLEHDGTTADPINKDKKHDKSTSEESSSESDIKIQRGKTVKKDRASRNRAAQLKKRLKLKKQKGNKKQKVKKYKFGKSKKPDESSEEMVYKESYESSDDYNVNNLDNE